MYVDAIKMAEKAMFPIISHGIRKKKIGKKVHHGFAVGINGTGFFISEDGMFLTADHIIESVNKSKLNLMYFGCLPTIKGQPKPMKILHRCHKRDLCIGKVDVESNYLVIPEENIPLGSSIITGGYPDSKIHVKSREANKFDINMNNITQYWHPSTVIRYHKSRKFRNNREYDAIILHEHGIKGISGGPIVCTDGKVGGLFTTDIRKGGNGKTIDPLRILNNSAGVSVNEIRNFLDEYKKGLTNILPKAS